MPVDDGDDHDRETTMTVDLSTGDYDGQCPGCNREIGDPHGQPDVIDHAGAFWHRVCRFAARDDIDRVGTAFRCPECGSESRWRPDAGPATARCCPTCGYPFDGAGRGGAR